jgi:hypothetical protein
MSTVVGAIGAAMCFKFSVHPRIPVRSFSSVLALISGTMVWPISIALALSIGGSSAFAEILPGATCPPDFTCFPPEPRDGACQHPALVFDAKTKATRYEGDRFSRAYEKGCIAQANSSAVRRGRELRLKLSDGASKVYKDEPACENGPYERCKRYILYDYFPEHRLFLVNVGYYENNEWFLVSQLNGKEQQIVAPPGYSPNRKWLASVYATEGPDDGNNGIDIVPANLNPTKPAFHYKPKGYEQWEFVGWDGDDRLLLKVTWRVGNDPELVTWPAEVVRVNDKWQLNRWAPSSSRP